jgi:hypothetical protein
VRVVGDEGRAIVDALNALPHRYTYLIYVEGQKVTFEYRWAEGKYDQLPILADELIKRQPVVLFAPGLPAALSIRSCCSRLGCLRRFQ